MDVDGYDMPDELYYHKGHCWVRAEGNKAVSGLNDFTQKLAGEISYVEVPEEGKNITQGAEIGTVETGKWVGKIYAPVSGKIIKVNEAITDDPAMINSEPYSKGWLFEVEMSDTGELKNLMKGSDAVSWLKTEIIKHAK